MGQDHDICSGTVSRKELNLKENLPKSIVGKKKKCSTQDKTRILKER